MIESLQTGLDRRPRLRLAQRVVVDAVLALLGVMNNVASMALMGAAVLGLPLVVFTVLIAPEPGEVSLGTVLQIFALAGVCGGVAGMVLTAERHARDRSYDRRPPREAARDVVAQAIVARGLGGHVRVERLRLGLDRGGWLECHLCSLTFLRRGGAGRGEATRRRLMDGLTIALAGISASTPWLTEQERIADRVAEILALDALAGPDGDDVPAPTAAGVLEAATARIRSELAAVPQDGREQIEDELIRARSMRGRRLEYLLTGHDRVLEPETEIAVAATG